MCFDTKTICCGLFGDKCLYDSHILPCCSSISSFYLISLFLSSRGNCLFFNLSRHKQSLLSLQLFHSKRHRKYPDFIFNLLANFCCSFLFIILKFHFSSLRFDYGSHISTVIKFYCNNNYNQYVTIITNTLKYFTLYSAHDTLFLHYLSSIGYFLLTGILTLCN